MGRHLSRRLSECSVLRLGWLGLAHAIGQSDFMPVSLTSQESCPWRCVHERELLMPGCDWWLCCAGHKFKDTRSLSSGEGYWDRKKEGLSQSGTAFYFPSAPGCMACPLLESHMIPAFFPSVPGCTGAVGTASAPCSSRVLLRTQ